MVLGCAASAANLCLERLQLLRICAAGDQFANAVLYAGFVVRVGDAEPRAAGFDYRACGLLGLNQRVDHGWDIALGFHLIAMRFEECDEVLFQTGEQGRGEAPEVHGHDCLGRHRDGFPCQVVAAHHAAGIAADIAMFFDRLKGALLHATQTAID